MLIRLWICVPSFLWNKQKIHKTVKVIHSVNSNHTSVLSWHPEKTVAWKSRMIEKEQWDRSLNRPCCASIDANASCLLVTIVPLFFALFCSTIGRPRMYATESARNWERAQRAAERQKQQPCANVYLGKVTDVWNQTKCTTGITSDIEFAKCLFDRLVLCYCLASTIFTLF